ncbi:hypothetical protein FRC17_005536, partial [Serendipita sp. 399]
IIEDKIQEENPPNTAPTAALFSQNPLSPPLLAGAVDVGLEVWVSVMVTTPPSLLVLRTADVVREEDEDGELEDDTVEEGVELVDRLLVLLRVEELELDGVDELVDEVVVL